MPLYHDALPDDDDGIEASPRALYPLVRPLYTDNRAATVLDSPSNGALAKSLVPSPLTRHTSRVQQADSGPAAHTEVNCGLQQAFANLRRPYPATLLQQQQALSTGFRNEIPTPSVMFDTSILSKNGALEATSREHNVRRISKPHQDATQNGLG